MEKIKQIVEEKQLKIITIEKRMSVLDFFDYLDNSEQNASIPTRLYLTEGDNLLESEILPQTIYSFQEENWNYILAIGENRFILSGTERTDQLDETQISWNQKLEELRIISFIHTLEFSTKETKAYTSKNLGEAFSDFELDKASAHKKALDLLNQLSHSQYANVVLRELEFLYHLLESMLTDVKEIKTYKIES